MHKKILNFIHVGKCAGSSIKTALNFLKINFIEYHCYDANLKLSNKFIANSLDNYFLLCVRDPILRFVSAFYWDFYEKILVQNQRGPDGIWKSLYDTFRKPNEVGEALSSDNEKIKRDAETFIFKSNLHAEFSLSWYIKLENLKYLNSNNLKIIKTENADKDFQDFLSENYGITDYGSLPKEKSNYKSLIKNYDSSLTELAKNNLKHTYSKDYLILDELYRRGLINVRY